MAGSSALDTFITTIQSLYQRPETSNQSINYTEIYNVINSNLNYTDFFTSSTTSLLDNVLPIFVLPEYTLPNMAVLYAIVTQTNNKAKLNASLSPNAVAPTASLNDSSVNDEQLMACLENCVGRADRKQVIVASEIYSELCRFLTKRLTQTNRPKRGLVLLRTAIQNLQYDSNQDTFNQNKLTSVHASLLQLSLASKNFTIALDLLSNEILDIHRPFNAKFDSKYLLGYFYYGGCIYGAMKDYKCALFFLEQALSVPALVISQIMIESYKKFILISLISKGKLPTLPKYTSRIVLSQIKPLCIVYHEIANAFTNFESDKLNSLCQKYHNSFEADGNLGLTRQLKHSFYKNNIKKLTKTFITLSLSDMALKVKLPSAREAESYMLNMIKDGEIFATMNQKDGMVSFHDNPEKYNNPVIMESLTNEMFACIKMNQNIRDMDKEITTHPHYIQKCQNSSSIDENIDSLQSTNISSMRQQSSSNLAM